MRTLPSGWARCGGLAWAAAWALLAAGCDRERQSEAAYVAAVDSWHAEREARLRDETGWLTLVGLHPLPTGELAVGSAPDADVRLIDKAPARVGTLSVAGGAVTFTAAPGAAVFLAGSEPPAPVTTLALETDRDGAPTVLSCGSLVFHVIERGGDLFLRVKDRQSALLAGFTGVDRYPVDGKWRVLARLRAAPTTLTVPNVLGQETVEQSPGELEFELEGRVLRLVPTGDPARGLFIVFGDSTNGHGTYPGGRFLSTDAVGALGTVVLDFNRAVNPPCVFTPYATCPLPPPQNLLPVAVAAGEKMGGAGHH